MSKSARIGILIVAVVLLLAIIGRAACR